jgi:hypothetical protein
MSEQLRPPDSVCTLVPSGMLGAGYTPDTITPVPCYKPIKGGTRHLTEYEQQPRNGTVIQFWCELPGRLRTPRGGRWVTRSLLRARGRRAPHVPALEAQGIPVLRSDRNAIVSGLLGEAGRTR